MDAVKSYLTWLKDRPYLGTKLTANSTPLVTAVQIALESKGFDTGKIDGILGNGTRSAVVEFQKKYNDAHKDSEGKYLPGFKPLVVDGKPGPKTIAALL
jgi:peptidoglycan hydrolase-like protein with peptidoglycan-binding domain